MPLPCQSRCDRRTCCRHSGQEHSRLHRLFANKLDGLKSRSHPCSSSLRRRRRFRATSFAASHRRPRSGRHCQRPPISVANMNTEHYHITRRKKDLALRIALLSAPSDLEKAIALQLDLVVPPSSADLCNVRARRWRVWHLHVGLHGLKRVSLGGVSDLTLSVSECTGKTSPPSRLW